MWVSDAESEAEIERGTNERRDAEHGCLYRQTQRYPPIKPRGPKEPRGRACRSHHTGASDFTPSAYPPCRHMQPIDRVRHGCLTSAQCPKLGWPPMLGRPRPRAGLRPGRSGPLLGQAARAVPEAEPQHQDRALALRLASPGQRPAETVTNASWGTKFVQAVGKDCILPSSPSQNTWSSPQQCLL